jgi:lipoyl(octanoyl) transferase
MRRLEIRWLGRVPYREAWDLQHALVAERVADHIPDTLLLLEHPRVLTLGRNASEEHVVAPAADLDVMGVEVIRVERGGEVTYHGPGQLVAYPIVRLAESGLLVRPFVRLLEAAMIETAATYGVPAGRREGLPGAWCDPDGPLPRKLGALGVRVEQDVSYHGIALNVTTDLDDFGLINPCGMAAVAVTSIAREAGWSLDRSEPSTASVERAAERFAGAFGRLLDAAREAAGGSAVPAGDGSAAGQVGRAGDGGAAGQAPAPARIATG